MFSNGIGRPAVNWYASKACVPMPGAWLPKVCRSLKRGCLPAQPKSVRNRVLHGRLIQFGEANGTCIRDYIHVFDLVAAHCDALAYLRAGGASTTLNCGYGRGFSVLEVMESVKRVSGVDFKVEFTGGRPGDPAQIVAACDHVRATLKWRPCFNDLETIIAHALAWERTLSSRAS